MELKDKASVPGAVGFVLQHPAIDSLRDPGYRLLIAFCKLDDPSLAKEILPLLYVADSRIRRTGIDVLRRMKSPVAIPALMTLLDDKDQSVQYDAMMTVAETAQIYSLGSSPSTDVFQQDPQAHLNWWKKWWEREGKEKYGEATTP